MNAKEIVYDNSDINDVLHLPTNLKECIEWLQERIESIPEQFRDSAEIEMDVYEEYGCPYQTYIIQYERPETKEERTRRRSIENMHKAEVRRVELNNLKRLKEKYPTA